MAWSYGVHIRTYSYDSYPRYLLPVAYGETTGWINNIYRPLRKTARDLDETLGPQSTTVSLIDGALGIFYYPSEEGYALFTW